MQAPEVRGRSGVLALWHPRPSAFWPCGPQGRIRSGLVAHKARTVLVLWHTRPFLLALWHSGTKRFRSWVPQGQNLARLREAETSDATKQQALARTAGRNVRSVTTGSSKPQARSPEPGTREPARPNPGTHRPEPARPKPEHENPKPEARTPDPQATPGRPPRQAQAKAQRHRATLTLTSGTMGG